MADVLVHLDGSVEETLKRLVEMGFFKTKAEAVRAGILEVGKNYHIIKSKDEILDELAVEKMQQMQSELKEGKRRALSLAEIRKKYPEAF